MKSVNEEQARMSLQTDRKLKIRKYGRSERNLAD